MDKEECSECGRAATYKIIPLGKVEEIKNKRTSCKKHLSQQILETGAYSVIVRVL